MLSTHPFTPSWPQHGESADYWDKSRHQPVWNFNPEKQKIKPELAKKLNPVGWEMTERSSPARIIKNTRTINCKVQNFSL